MAKTSTTSAASAAEKATLSGVRQGVEAPIVQQLAGHKSIVTTQLYIGRMSKADIATRVPRAFTATYGRAV